MLLGTGQGVDAVAAGDMHHVHIRLEDFDLFGRFFRHDAALHAVRAVQTQFDEQAVPDDPADFPEDHQREAAAVLDGAAEFVAAVIGERREEIVDQPAVREMKHQTVKVGDLRPVGIFAEQRGDFFHVFPCGGCGAEVGFVVGGNFLEPRAHVGAAVDEFRKGSAVEGMHRALETLEVHLVAGLGVQVEAVFVAAVDGHFHGQRHGGESPLNEAHPEVDAEGVDAAVAVFAAAGGTGADGGHADAVVEADPVPADIHRLEEMGILFLVDRFHRKLLYGLFPRPPEARAQLPEWYPEGHGRCRAKRGVHASRAEMTPPVYWRAYGRAVLCPSVCAAYMQSEQGCRGNDSPCRGSGQRPDMIWSYNVSPASKPVCVACTMLEAFTQSPTLITSKATSVN